MANRSFEPSAMADMDHRVCFVGATANEYRALVCLWAQSHEVEKHMKSLKGYKTILFNLLTLAVTASGFVLQYLGQLGLDDKTFALVAIALNIFAAAANLWLRSVTTTAVGKSI